VESDIPLRLVTHPPRAPGPIIEITPTPEEYDQLGRDLAKLRKQGAPSNTAAILKAVRLAASTGD
jgi:hypothetical protein